MQAHATWRGIAGGVIVCALAAWEARVPGAAQDAFEGWTVYSQREEIAPKAWVERSVRLSGGRSLALAGRGDVAVNGSWRKVVPVEAGRTYRFSAAFLARRVNLQRRSILARVTWIDAKGPRAERHEYPPTIRQSTGGDPGAQASWGRVEGWCTAPESATKAQLEIIFRWDTDGEVFWDAVTFEAGTRPRRPVRLATIYCRPKGSKSPQESVETFAALVLEAAGQKPDFICLPEGITVIGTGKKYVEVAEPIPGPTTRCLGELARQVNAYLIAGIYEREGLAVYNTSVLIGRDGRLLGRYRKVSLPNEEIDGGITPGDAFPVFQTDFGKVGMMICWDVHFPEPARALAAGGAEIIFLPIWGGNKELMEARPIENQLYMVTSSYDAPTAIYDRRGAVLAEANADNPIAVTEIDLAETTRWRWLGDFRGRIPHEAPPLTTDLP